MDNPLDILEQVPLAEFTTFKIGGEARFFIEVNSEFELVEALEFAEEKSLEVFILGGGSNILIADEGFDGLVLKIGLKGIFEYEEKERTVYITAKAGEDWDDFVEFCISKDLAGVECLSGIPGLIGGTPIQNVGAYGQEVSETIVSVEVYDRKHKQIKQLLNSECGFQYRRSIFNTTERDRYIVLSVTYALKRDGEPKIVYGELTRRFAGKNPTLKEARKFVCDIRKSKGMLVRQGGLDARSVGSFFKNPIVDHEKFSEVQRIAKKLCHEQVPSYFVDEGNCKIPAAWLIEQTGFYKGFAIGNAGLSTKHSLALTNRGNASAREILELKITIQKKVEKTFDITLIPEPNFVGYDDDIN